MCKSIWLRVITTTTITMSALTTVRTTMFAITTMNKHNKSDISQTTKT